MQLSLFEDNLPGILLNIAEEHLRAGDIEKSIAVYDKIVTEYPGERSALELGTQLKSWRERLAAVHPQTCTSEQLASLKSELDPVTNPVLRQMVLEFILDAFEQSPEPDSVYIPPGFHRGHLLIELKRYSAAADSFQNALSVSELPRGRFLAWRADALTMGGQKDEALRLYLQAFLDDPSTVDFAAVRNTGIKTLDLYLYIEEGEIDEEDLVAWLPVWGWMYGLFPLPLHSPPDTGESADAPIPRRWFELLTRAEYFRTVTRDDRELVAVRRTMKKLNAPLFQRYMDKIRSR